MPRAGPGGWERGRRRGRLPAAVEARARRAHAAAPDGRVRLRNLVVREGRRTGQLQVRLVTTEGELEADSLAAALSEALGESLAACCGRARAASPRRPPAARPSWSGARPSCPSAWASSTCASPPRRSSRRTPRWPSVLYGIVAEYAALEGWERVYDLYCGHRHDRADARPARRRAVGDRAGRAGRRRRDRRARGATRSRTPASSPATCAWRCPSCCERAGRPDVLVVDPPRAGLSKKVVRRIIEASPKRIVYVSCNPTTLAPNAAELVEAGWTLREGAPGGHVPADAPHRVRGAVRADCQRAGRARASRSRSELSSRG